MRITSQEKKPLIRRMSQGLKAVEHILLARDQNFLGIDEFDSFKDSSFV